MPNVKTQAQPGFNSQATQLQAGGGWFAGNLIRWRMGFLEKMAGWVRLIDQPLGGHIRRMHAWFDLDNHKNLLVGTDAGVQIVVNDGLYGLGLQATLLGGTDPYSGDPGSARFSAVLATFAVKVTTAAEVSPGSSFVLRLPVSIGGRILPAGSTFSVTALVPGGFTFNMPLLAVVNEPLVYGIPFFVNTAANEMTGTFNAHGYTVITLDTTAIKWDTDALTFDNEATFTFDETTTLIDPALGVNFSAPAGTVVAVRTVPTANTFTFLIDTLGSGTGLGGTVYDGWQVDMSAVPTTAIPAVLAGLTTPVALPDPQHQSWFLKNLGETGLVLATGGPLFTYTPPIESGPWLTQVGGGPPATAPQVSNGMITAMPQAQVILFGSEPVMGSGTIDPLLLRWSDAGTFDVWTATVTNQAGSYRLGSGSRIMGAIQAPQSTLILTDTDLWSMSYIGPPLIYGFTVMGTGCGLVAPHAIATLGRTTYWQGQNGYWQFGDGGVQPLMCSVWDYIFKNLDTANINKCHLGANSSSNEIMSFFPPLTSVAATPSNFLLWSQDFDIASKWILGDATTSPSGAAAPDSTSTATDLIELTDTSEHNDRQDVFKEGERTTYTLSVYARTSSTRNLYLGVSSTVAGVWAIFNPVAGTVISHGLDGSAFTFLAATASTDDLATGGGGNQWLRYALSFISDDGPRLHVTIGLANAARVNYAGVAGFKVVVWGSQLNSGSAAQPYVATGASLTENEPHNYVKFNTVEPAWDDGVLLRTAWLDNNVFGPPLGGDANFRIQQHERGYDDDDQPMRGVYAETGYNDMASGSVLVSIKQCFPDFKWFGVNGALTVTLKCVNYPGDKQQSYGPYSVTPTTRYFNPRARARMSAVRYDWMPRLGYSARIGATEFKVGPAGRRP